MNYERIYNELIKARRSAPVPEGYTETHHIIPKSLGGSDDADNLIALTPEDHFMAHRLLAKIHGGKMSQALWLMCRVNGTSARGVYVSRLIFGVVRREYAKTLSHAMSGKGNHMYGRTGKAHPLYGRHHSAESIAKISEALRGKNHYLYGKHLIATVREKISAATSGEGNPMFGRHHSEAARARMSEAMCGVNCGSNNGQYDHTQYVFQHPVHGERICTKYELRQSYVLHKSNLSKLVQGKLRTTGGWRCLGAAE